jgi:S-adenosyl-L-methionine hydrolase (adenosine-forming)
MKKARPRKPAKAGRRPIVLLTDFGDGPFQGVMKAVILSRGPDAPIVIDFFHHVRPGAVLEGAYTLASGIAFFRKPVIFCCVVDPGVGTARRRIVVAAKSGHLAVGPDNGLLTPLIEQPGSVVREITNPSWFEKDATKTFEGRSRFAPAAATLARGARPAGAGPIVRDPVVLSLRSARTAPGMVTGEVVYADSFGNLVTSIHVEDLRGADAALQGAQAPVVVAGTRKPIPFRATYSDVAVGKPVAYMGSNLYVEIGVRGGNALLELGVDVGTTVVVRTGKRRGS